MRRLFLVILSAVSLMTVACGSNREHEISNIENLEQQLSPFEIFSDDNNVQQLIECYTTFAAHFPDDSLAPIYLFKAADINNSIGNPHEAIDLLDTIIALYPGFDDLGGCWFLKGYAYEMAESYDSAKATYAYFVENYPDHVQAPSTRIALQRNLVGLSQEELNQYLLENANDSNLVQGNAQ